MKKLIVALCFLVPLFARSADLSRISFSEYSRTIGVLASECASRDKPTFSGFCLSKKYEKKSTTSITVALEVAAFEHFLNKCEHTDYSNARDLLIEALSIEEAKTFYEEMKPQDTAIDNYSNHFYFCKTKEENDAVVLKRVKWFEFMLDRDPNYKKDKESGFYLNRKP